VSSGSIFEVGFWLCLGVGLVLHILPSGEKHVHGIVLVKIAIDCRVVTNNNSRTTSPSVVQVYTLLLLDIPHNPALAGVSRMCRG